MSKRDRPSNFFEEDDDLDYLIEASIEHNAEKENEFIGFDDYMNQKPVAPKPGKIKRTLYSTMVLTKCCSINRYSPRSFHG